MLPPEFLNNDTIDIGDTYEKISHLVTLIPNVVPGVVSGKSVIKGMYALDKKAMSGGINFVEFDFNSDNLLVSACFSTRGYKVQEGDSVVRSVAQLLSKYYGECLIYDKKDSEYLKTLVWSRSDSAFVVLPYFPYVLNKDRNMRNSISIYFNPCGISDLLDNNSLNTMSRKELGLE